MKILYDAQIFESQKIGGISRYFFELLSSFEKTGDVDVCLPIRYSDNVYLHQLKSINGNVASLPLKPNHYRNFFWGKEFRGKQKLYGIKKKIFPDPSEQNPQKQNQELAVQKIKEGNFDLFHPTYYDNYFLDLIGDKPFVITVYDLIHQIFPEFLIYDTRDKNREILGKAKKIIAISESTKRDLVTLFEIPEDKVVVTYLANSLSVDRSIVREEFKSKVPVYYILFVGTRGGYKNFLFFVQVISSLFQQEKDLHVVCTGSAFTQDELFFLSRLGFRDRFTSLFVDDAELTYLYKNAVAFIFPSQYEGFGLPILEAMNCGCLALLSNTSSLPEVGGDAAIYFAPKDPTSLVGAIKTALYNQQERVEKIKLGYEQVKKFSWEKLCLETVKIYQDVLRTN
ncbi:MAG: glycosyltransferase family 1 protein [Flavobacterium sp.]|nr:MAG: glycosyltransferase family 1 protein [Flavobacterium sp.]